MDAKYQFALDIIKQAADFLREHMDQVFTITEKSNPQDLVTDLDTAIQELLSREILDRYPTDHIFGEEGGDVSSIDTGKVWLIDPIDGTTNFIAQKADFAIMMAYFEEGEGKFALIYDVMQDKLFHGGGQYPVYVNEDVLQPAQLAPLHRSLIGLNAKLYASNSHGLADFANQTLGTRSVGSAGIGFSHVLEGRLMAYASHLYPWDYAAASVLGSRLGYRLLSLENDQPRFDGREQVMLVPNSFVEEVERYIK